ncbi:MULTISPECIES: amino acid ABC transporter permease [Caballeronia]|jgi:polar amino acid transport system permease protein|uniref:Polar amino acid ABC transporter permease n=1 Tax=Caballeronia zhejiangensis TaxID=871203 RepID=A0A656QT81_9BURK|nr:MULTISPECIES: amino acid ABC transporter permease [Caballeronia]EKS71036.1 polar amino acid ABC transporter inner membrane protein [Burkholderia sp. SJ98]KDR34060.1 polar amino acid ABC transporter permease [Caballeronia zhejiangensis]MCG7404628.1 amino acid ABC transporter permease [Caballeronia zhejiangensis]MCI1044054.1 amino acid ABC transporter permease [Caballeronia zhejiangensis]MDR5788940.1 amino acid ABC transporter permease [Caballeronia sp. LP003]
MNEVDWFASLRYLLLGAFPSGPLGGVALTLALSISSAILAAIIGLAGGIALSMTRGVAQILLTALVAFFRAIPVLMLIFWTFFLMPILLHVNVPGLATVVCALALIGGAYLSHSVHAGIVSIGNGQWQAAMSLGLTRWQALREVVLPQAVRVMMPSFVNQWVSLIKDTSLAYIVGVPEFTFLANQLNNRLMVYPAQIFLFVGFVYLMLCGALQALAHALLSRRSAERSRVRTMPAMQRRKARL